MTRPGFDVVHRPWEPALRRFWSFRNRVTIGVRALVIDDCDRIFLVKHSYVSGWHLPGGGVEVGETIMEALIRELAEEGNIKPTGPPVLHGVFLNTRGSRRDHVVVFILRDFRQTAEPVPGAEIIAHGFFALSDLPNDTAAPTKARINEILCGAPISERW